VADSGAIGQLIVFTVYLMVAEALTTIASNSKIKVSN
jgi:hypothetical protein